MKRFGLSLSDEVYNEFLRYFPDHGSRTVILRRCVIRLTERARTAGKVWDREVDNIVDNLAGRQNKTVEEIEKEIYGGEGETKWGY